jgi:hypothetical protein
MLLCLSSGCWKIVSLDYLGFWPGQNLVELAGDVSLEAADDLFLGQAFGGAAILYRSKIGFGSLTCRFRPVGAEYSATLCDLRVFMNEAAEPVSSEDLDVGVDGVG